jgi:hypothetical protein
MPISSCIRHPANEPLVIVRKWQLIACEDNACAAALLSFLEHRYNIKLEQRRKAIEANDVAEMHGEARTQNENLWQWYTEEELEAGIFIYKRTSIRAALALLEKKGFITISNNPNPRYKFDKTRFFIFHADKVNEWIDNYTKNLESQSTVSSKNVGSSVNFNSRSGKINGSSLENNGSSVKNESPSLENEAQSGENNGTITKISTKISTENKEQQQAAAGEPDPNHDEPSSTKGESSENLPDENNSNPETANPETTHPGIAIYQQVIGVIPPLYSQDLIRAKVADLEVWKDICEQWKANNNDFGKVGNMLDRYGKEVAKKQQQNSRKRQNESASNGNRNSSGSSTNSRTQQQARKKNSNRGVPDGRLTPNFVVGSPTRVRGVQ